MHFPVVHAKKHWWLKNNVLLGYNTMNCPVITTRLRGLSVLCPYFICIFSNSPLDYLYIFYFLVKINVNLKAKSLSIQYLMNRYICVNKVQSRLRTFINTGSSLNVLSKINLLSLLKTTTHLRFIHIFASISYTYFLLVIIHYMNIWHLFSNSPIDRHLGCWECLGIIN